MDTISKAPKVPTSTEKVLNHPEIVSLVFQELSKRDLFHFLTNRYFFELAIPHIWRHVPDVRHILALLGGPSLASHVAKWSRSSTQIEFPSGIRQSQLVRFNIYKTHVRTIEIFGDPDNPILWVKLESIGLSLARSDFPDEGGTSAPSADPIVDLQLPLLPRLRVLEVMRHQSGGAKSTSHELLQWIRIFCSATCTTIRMTGMQYTRACWMNGPDTAATFHILTQRCTSLKHLELFCKPSRLSQNEVVTFDPALLRQIANFFNHSARLKTLSLGGDAISPCALTALARMPNLNTLVLRYRLGTTAVTDNISMLERPFPSLTRLGLYHISTGSLRSLLSIGCLFQHLQALTVDLDATSPLGEQDEIMRSIFQGIVEVAPQLQDLAFVLSLGTHPITRLLPTTIEVLAELDLTWLRLEGVRIQGAQGFGTLHGKWPSLEGLLWPQQSVTTADLAIFARRKSLGYLAVSLFGARPVPPSGVSATPINPGSLEFQSDFPFHDFDSDDLEKYARYLQSCWGGILIMMVDQPTTVINEQSTADFSYFNVIQDHLQRLRKE